MIFGVLLAVVVLGSGSFLYTRYKHHQHLEDQKAAELVAASNIVCTVEGMDCGGCVKKVKAALIKAGGVETAFVSLVAEKAGITLQKGKSIQVAELKEAVAAQGFTLKEDELTTTGTVLCSIEGMTGENDINMVKSALEQIEGVEAALVRSEFGKAEIIPKEGQSLQLGQLKQAAEEAGFTLKEIEISLNEAG